MKIKLQTMLKHNWRTLLLLCTLITTSLEVCSTTTGVYVTTTRTRDIYYHIWNSSGTPSACAGTKWDSHRELVSSATKLDDTSGGGFYKLECDGSSFNIIFLSVESGDTDQTTDRTINTNKWMRLGESSTCDELMTESNLSSEGKVKFASSALSGISTTIPAVWNSTEKKFILQSACYTNSDNGGIHIYINESSTDYEYLYVNTYTSSGTYDIKWDPYSGNITFDSPTPPQTIVDVLSGTKIWFYSGTTSTWDIKNIYLNNGSTDVVSNASGSVVTVSNIGAGTANLAAVNLASAQYYLSNQDRSHWSGVQMSYDAKAGKTYVLSSGDKYVCDGSGDRVCELDGISITNLKFDNISGDDTKTVSSGTDVSIFAQSATTATPFNDGLKIKYYVKKSGESTYYTECGWEASVANTTGTTGTLTTDNLSDGTYTVYVLLMNAADLTKEAVKASSTLTLTVQSCTYPAVQTVSGDADICSSSSTDITVGDSESGYIYVLYKDGSATESTQEGTGSSFTFSVDEEGEYTVKAYDSSTLGCLTDMDGSATVSILPDTELTGVSLDPSSICLNGTSTATATGAVLGGGTGAWSKSGSAVASVTNTEASSTVKTSTVTASSSTSGDATITYTITNGCDATAHTKTATISKSATITVKPNASVSGATITFEPSGETCNGNGTRATIDGEVLGGGTGAWSRVSGTGGSAIDATTGVITGVTTGTSGSHTFRYTITGGCSGTPTKDGSVTLGYSPILSPVQKTVKAYEPVSITSTNANITEWSLSTESSTNYLYDTGKRSAKFKGAPGKYTIKAAASATGLNCPGSATITVEADNDCTPVP